MTKQYIGISRDHSGSMSSIAKAAARDYNETISHITHEATTQGIDTIVSVMKCATALHGGGTRNFLETVNSSISALKPMNESAYDTRGSHTPLWDSINELIDALERAPDAADPNVSFLVMAITDGEDNGSRTHLSTLMTRIKKLQMTDRWTFVFRVPKGYNARNLVNAGIPDGNIMEWETTQRGMEQSNTVTKAAFTKFYEERKLGKTASRGFYTDLSNVSTDDVKAALSDISVAVNMWYLSADAAIRPYVEAQTGKPMKKGAAFYQLTKREDEVQDYKMVVIRDKTSGAVYGGVAARQLLGLPAFGTVAVNPGNHGQFDIFIQSTSINRKLLKGTTLLYWPDFDKPIPATAAPAVKPAATTPAPAPVTAKPTAKPVTPTVARSQSYIDGYKVGFPAGKAKQDRSNVVGTVDYILGYNAGYKDGRGKQKRLYK